MVSEAPEELASMDVFRELLSESVYFSGSFGNFGDETIDFHVPISIDVLKNGNYVIADRKDNRILIFDTKMQPYNIFSVGGIIRSCAVTVEDDIILALDGDDILAACSYTAHGALLQTFPRPQGRKFSPCGITCSQDYNGSTFIISTMEGICYVYDDNAIIIQVL